MRKKNPLLVILLCSVVILPCHAANAEEKGPSGNKVRSMSRSPINDVALQPGGILSGQVVDAQGLPSAGLDLRVWRGNEPVAESRTDEKGDFEVTLKQGGVYRVCTEIGVVTLRVWQPGTAPPQASSRALIVNDANVFRAQWNPTQALFTHPGIAIGIGALLIAIPIILHNNRADRESPAS